MYRSGVEILLVVAPYVIMQNSDNEILDTLKLRPNSPSVAELLFFLLTTKNFPSCQIL
jgi:hypothetical protein